MRIRSFIVYLWLLLLAVSSCIYDADCPPPIDRADNLKLLPLWADVAAPPPTVFVQGYPLSGGAVMQNFVASTGGTIYLPPATYRLLLYTTRSTRVAFRMLDAMALAEAYVAQGDQPDELFAGDVPEVTVTPTYVDREVAVPMVDLVKRYPFSYRGIEGLQYVDRVSVTIDGINPAVNLLTQLPSPETMVVNCPFARQADGLSGLMRCFGHGEAQQAHAFVVRFEYAGRVMTRTYDVTEMLNKLGRIDLVDSLRFEPVGQGGVDAGVGDWGDDVVDIPIVK